MKNILLILMLFTNMAYTQNYKISIIPEPERITANEGHFTISNNTTIIASGVDEQKSATFFIDYIRRYFGINLDISEKFSEKRANCIEFSICEEKSAVCGAYTLTANTNSIELRGANKEGLFYAMQSLIQLLPTAPNRELRVQAVDIADKPRFEYRGMHLDVVRHIFPLDFIKRYIDYIALHKMNYFHLHLTDDQAWRIESKKYPQLNSIGSWRDGTIIGIFPGTGFDSTRYGGYYTIEELKEVVSYAADRYITVIPEIDIPGHSMATIATFPELSTTPDISKKPATTWGIFNRQNNVLAPSEKTFQFLEDVFTELMEIFPSPYIHIGADECAHKWWKESSSAQEFIKQHNLKDEKGLQRYFVKQVYDIVAKNGRKAIGWDEVVEEGGLVDDIIVMNWRDPKVGVKAATKGHKTIMAPIRYSYLNIRQREDEQRLAHDDGWLLGAQTVYGFDPAPDSLPKEIRSNIIGGQACMWTEYYATEEEVEYAIFPRMSAAAEIYWSPKGHRNWNSFCSKLPEQFKRYELWRAAYCKYLIETGDVKP